MNIGAYTFDPALRYDREHNWVRLEGDEAVIGVSDFFQKTAGEIVFIEVPLVGRTIETGAPFSSIESGKWVGRLKAPLSGRILEANAELTDFPYLLNESPYAEGWVIRIKTTCPDEIGALFDLTTDAGAKAFADFIAAEDERIAAAKG